MSRFPQHEIDSTRRASMCPDMAVALDAVFERMMAAPEFGPANVINLTEDQRFQMVRSGSPARWKELWDESADDAHMKQRFDDFVDLTPLQDRLAARSRRIRIRA